jgi:hypothetical protein
MGGKAVEKLRIFEGYKWLKEDCETAEGDERSRPRSDRTDENVEKV